MSPEHTPSPPLKENIKEASPKNKPAASSLPKGAIIDLGDMSDIFVNMGDLMDDCNSEGFLSQLTQIIPIIIDVLILLVGDRSGLCVLLWSLNYRTHFTRITHFILLLFSRLF